MNFGVPRMRLTKKQLKIVVMAAVAVLFALTNSHTFAQSFNTVIPMGEWAEYKKATYSGNPVIVHLRTGYENAVIFPEPVNIRSIDNKLVRNESQMSLPNCVIEINVDTVGFSPLRRFTEQRVTLRGADTGIIYDLLVSSSPNGSRQPLEINN